MTPRERAEGLGWRVVEDGPAEPEPAGGDVARTCSAVALRLVGLSLADLERVRAFVEQLEGEHRCSSR